MPELPEVETIRTDLEKSLKGKSIVRIKINAPKSVKNSAAKFTKDLTDQTFGNILRRGKLLNFTFKDPEVHVLAHLKMTGQFIHIKGRKVKSGKYGLSKLNKGLAYAADDKTPHQIMARALPNAYTRIQFDLTDQSTLFFNDVRRFGYLKLVNRLQRDQTFSTYGVEPLTATFTPNVLHQALKGRNTPLKAALLDQSRIAGLGNIYIDESCFLAGIRPGRKAGKVTQKECEKLHRAIVDMLTKALSFRGTSFRDYRDAQGQKGGFVELLAVYGRTGEPCVTCQTPVKKTTVAQRGTHYCPRCQK